MRPGLSLSTCKMGAIVTISPDFESEYVAFSWCSVNEWKSRATAMLGIRWQKQGLVEGDELTSVRFSRGD